MLSFSSFIDSLSTALSKPLASLQFSIPGDFRSSLELKVKALLRSQLFLQLFPFIVLFGLPVLALFGYTFASRVAEGAHRMLSSALGLLWWGSAGSNGSGEGSQDGRKKRRRAKMKEKEMNGNAVSGSSTDDDLDLCYPGLVNISGTYCFLNSILQALASLAYLEPHIEAIRSRAVDLDVPTPVVDTLIDTLKSLNSPKSRPSSFRPVPMINALSQPSGSQGRSRLFSSREHQDAQELFQLLSEFLKSEAQAVDKEAQRDRGLGAFASFASSSDASSVGGDDDEDEELAGAGVFDGLTANRRSCVTCGYTEAVMHFACATWQLALPMSAIGGEVSLQSCLADFTRLEVLNDCLCRRCSMRATLSELGKEVAELERKVKEGGSELELEGKEIQMNGGPGEVSGKKKRRGKDKKSKMIEVKERIVELRSAERMVTKAIEEGRIEEDIPGIEMERVFSKASTKQAMIARPPKVLVLHLNRSVHYGAHAARNPLHVRFPEILDLTPYTTSGILSTTPQQPISPPPPAIPPRCVTPTQSIFSVPRVLYRLSAVVAHYGAHSYGHYVCFRRRPRICGESEEGVARPGMPILACPIGCECVQCSAYGPIRDAFPTFSKRKETVVRGPVKGHNAWLRISDDRVDECSLEQVLAEGRGAFLLFYERVQSGLGAGRGRGIGKVYANGGYARGTPRSSEETVRPDEMGLSVDSLVGNGDAAPRSVPISMSVPIPVPAVRPRVVRRTTAGRRRSVVPSAAVNHGSGFGYTSALAEGEVLEMATSAPDLRNLAMQSSSSAMGEERMTMSEMADDEGRSQPFEGLGDSGLSESVVTKPLAAPDVNTPEDTKSATPDPHSFRDDVIMPSQPFLQPNLPSSSSSSVSFSYPNVVPVPLPPSSPPPKSPPHTGPLSSFSPSSSSSVSPSSSPRPSSPSLTTSPTRQRKPKSRSSRNHTHGRGHIAAPLGLRA